MHEHLTALAALLLIAAAVGFAARRLGVHYNIALVVTGAVMGAARVPRVALDPELVIQVFLPILLFEAAIVTDLRRLREDMRPVVLLAVPGVLVTVAVAAAILHFGLGLPVSFALLLGSILAATDTIAVVATFRKVKAPARLRTIVENESLFNDGTALVAFSVILAAIQQGRFEVGSGLAQLAWVIVVGIGIGAAAGWGATQIVALTDDHLMEILLTVVVTYGAWVAAEAVHASPVLAVVAAGMTVGSIGWRAITPAGKVAIRSFWAVAAFGINSVLFLIIGLQFDFAAFGAAGLAIVWGLLALTVGRAAAVYSILPLLPRRFAVPRAWQHLLVWGNLKGSLSMALALSLPADLPHRDLIAAVVFGCAFITLVFQGLSLAPLARRLGIGRGAAGERSIDENQGRLLAARAAQRELDRLQQLGVVPLGTFQRMRASYQGAIARSERELRDLVARTPAEDSEHIGAVRRRLLEIEKAALQDAAGSGMIAEDVAEDLVEELDKALADRAEERS